MSEDEQRLEPEQKELLRVLAKAARADRGRPFFCGVSQTSPAFRVVGHKHLHGGHLEVLAAHLDYIERNLGFIHFTGERRSAFNITTSGLAVADALIAASEQNDSLSIPDRSGFQASVDASQQAIADTDMLPMPPPPAAGSHVGRKIVVGVVVTVIGGIFVLFVSKFVNRTPVYRLASTESCEVELFVERTHPTCGAVFNQRRDPLCGVELLNMGQSAACGVDDDQAHRVALKSIGYPGRGHKTNFCKDHGFAGHNGAKPNGHCVPFKRCRDASFGVDQFLLCRRKEFGVENYESCRHESFGVERWNPCRHESHGIEKYDY